MFFRGFCLLVIGCLHFATAAFAQEIKVLKISPQEETAMIQAPDGKKQVIKVGDKIKSCELRATG
jgi:hypothetical protein